MFEWLFKYPRHAYEQGELVFEGGIGTFWWVAAALLLALSVAFARRLSDWPWHRRAAVHALQVAAVGVLLAILAGPALQVLRVAPGLNSVAVLVDTSASMALPDASGAGSRLDRAKRLVAEGLVGDLPATIYGFDDGLRRAESEGLAPVGERSRLVHALGRLAGSYDQGALAAIVVLTDGAQTPGDQDDLEPLSGGVPIHTVGLGTRSIAGDAEIASVAVPSRPPPETRLTARVTIRHAWASAGSVRLRVKDGQSVLGALDVALHPDVPIVREEVSFASGGPGLKEITFELDTPTSDPLPGNDSRRQLLDVVGQAHRVLYLEGEPRWEFKFIRRAVEEDPAIELATWIRTTPRKTYRQGAGARDDLEEGFPATLEALYRYALVIVGSLPASALADEQHAWLESFVAERGGSVLALAGRHALAEGGWDVKPLARALPVELARAEPGAVSAYAAGEYAALATQEGIGSRLADIGGESGGGREERWASLPPLADLQRLGPRKAGATTLLEASGTGAVPGVTTAGFGDDRGVWPLLVVQPYGFGQAAVLATASTWRWRMRTAPDDERHGLFWRHLIRGLSTTAPATKRLRLTSAADALTLALSLKDSRHQPIDNATVTARVTAPDGQAFDVPLPPASGEGAFGTTVGASAPGVYRVDVAARAAGELGDGTTFTRLARVGGEDLEAFDAGMNEPLLSRIAAITGGRFWTPDNVGELARAISFGGAGIREQERLPLWDAPFLYLVLVLLKGLEWSLRRLWGSI